LETLQFNFSRGTPPATKRPAVLVGVVSSGNLEVLVEQANLNGECRVDVSTVAVGYKPIWQAVLTDFFDRHRIGDVRLSINDAGATPAVVGLRLEQALQEFLGTSP
jgi:malonate decarboxylase delta subunit